MFARRQLLSPKVLSLVRNRNISKLNFSSNNSEERCTQELPDVWHYQEWEKEGSFHKNVQDGYFRNVMNYGTVPLWTRRFTALPSVQGKNLLWLQLLRVDDEQKTAYLKLFTLGLKLATTSDDSDVVERLRKLFKDAAPFFMDFDLWFFSRSQVRKGYNGSIDAAALKFSPYDPLDHQSIFPVDPSVGIRCADIFLFFAVDGDVPGDDLCNREAVMDFLNALNSEDGIRKIHVFTVTSGSVVAAREELNGINVKHLSIEQHGTGLLKKLV
ncbi:uncharacterized protein LOC141656943 [Silene latifolia]|uniref:uncharacterized protein LOC141656943 n=1 Tax=Silene latifolia TaxID=37657 RepID=UPI003D7713FF